MKETSNWFGLFILVAIAAITLAPDAIRSTEIEMRSTEIAPKTEAELVASVPPKKPLPAGLTLLNLQRSQRGLGPLVLDLSLQRGAVAKASSAASRRYRGHLGGSLYGANKEGIGYGSSKTFRACYAYTAPAGTPVGAAMRQGSDQHWYCCLLVNYSGSLAAKPGGSTRSRRRLFR